MSNVIELDEWRAARADGATNAAHDHEEAAEWRRFIEVVARDVVEHLPDVVPWKQVREATGLPASTLSAAALSGGLVVTRVDGVLCLQPRRCEPVLIALMSVRLAVPRPLVVLPAN